MRADVAFTLFSAGTTYRSGRSPGGWGRLRWEDVAGACHGLPRLPWLIARWLWSGDDIAGIALLSSVEAIGRGIGMQPRMAEKCAGLALYELHDPHCLRCGGRGTEVRDSGLIADCPRCWGHGRHGMSGRERARWCGVSDSAWRESWAERHDAIFERLRRERDVAVAHVQARLSGPQ